MRLLKINFIVFPLIAICFGLLSCDNLAESSEVNQADEIKPIINLSGTLNNQTRAYNSKISVLIKNRSNHALEIEGGLVKVNGYTMTPPNNALLSSGKHAEYVFYSDLIPDELYVFEVILSNEQTYSAWVESPEVFPTILEVPQRVERKKDLQVKWQNTDYRYPQFLIIQIYTEDKGFSNDAQAQFNIDNPYYGSYLIDKKYIIYQNVSEQEINETRIILKAQTLGTLDQHFAPGGSITCTFKIYSDLEVY